MGDSCLDAEELLTQINGDERLADLFAATMDSALKTRWQAKLRALGMVLAAGVTGDSDTRVDDAETIGRALEGLEAPHMRVLATLGEAKRINPGQPHGLAAWIAKYWPKTALTSGEIAAYLTARGLIVDPFYANGVLELSPLGHRVLALVRQAERAELGLPAEPSET